MTKPLPERRSGLLPEVDLLTIQEVGAVLRVSVRTVERLVKSGDLRCVRVGGQRRFHRADVVAFVAASTSGGPLAGR